jgi:hypothetical protein
VALTHASYYAAQMKTMVQDKGFLHTSCVYRDKNTNKFYLPDGSYVRQFLRCTIAVTLQVKATPHDYANYSWQYLDTVVTNKRCDFYTF